LKEKKRVEGKNGPMSHLSRINQEQRKDRIPRPKQNIPHMIMHLQHPLLISSTPFFSGVCGCWGIISANGATTCIFGVGYRENGPDDAGGGCIGFGLPDSSGIMSSSSLGGCCRFVLPSWSGGRPNSSMGMGSESFRGGRYLEWS